VSLQGPAEVERELEARAKPDWEEQNDRAKLFYRLAQHAAAIEPVPESHLRAAKADQ